MRHQYPGRTGTLHTHENRASSQRQIGVNLHRSLREFCLPSERFPRLGGEGFVPHMQGGPGRWQRRTLSTFHFRTIRGWPLQSSGWRPAHSFKCWPLDGATVHTLVCTSLTPSIQAFKASTSSSHLTGALYQAPDNGSFPPTNGVIELDCRYVFQDGRAV